MANPRKVFDYELSRYVKHSHEASDLVDGDITYLRLDATNDPMTGDLDMGANNFTITGSLSTTGARATKGWFTDLEVTNMPTVGGTDIQDTFVDVAGDTMTGLLTANGGLTTGGSRIKSRETSTTTATMADTVEVHVCNSASDYTLTLPTHETDKEIRIINKGAGVVTLSPTSGNVKGSPTKTLNQWESLILISDNTDWL